MADDDIRAAAEAAFAEVEATQAEPVAAVSTDTPEATETEAKPARARDETGKFAKTEPEAEPKPAVEAKDKPVEATDKPAVEKDKPLGTEPPSNWSAADKATFNKLDPAGKEFLLRRHRDMEADHTRKTQDIASYRKEYEKVDSLLAPHAEALTARGFTKSSIIEAWYTVEKRLMEGDGVNIIKGLVDGYKINPAEVAKVLGLAGPQNAPAPTVTAHAPAVPAVDPATQAELKALRDRLSGIEAEKRLDAENGIKQTLERFVSETGEDGQPLHPYFNELEADMALQVQAARTSGRAIPTLAELYEKTVWANPETRAKLLASQREAEQKKEREQARAKAEAAKKASSSVRGAPGSGQAPETRKGSGSLREDLAAALEDAA